MAFRKRDAVLYCEYVGDDLSDAASTIQCDSIADADRRKLDDRSCIEGKRFARSRNLCILLVGQCILFLSGKYLILKSLTFINLHEFRVKESLIFLRSNLVF